MLFNPQKNLQHLCCSKDCIYFFGNHKTKQTPYFSMKYKPEGFVIIKEVNNHVI